MKKCAYCGKEIKDGAWEAVGVATATDEGVACEHYLQADDTQFCDWECLHRYSREVEEIGTIIHRKQETIDSLSKDRSYLSKRVAKLEAENAELHATLDDLLYEPDVSQDEVMGYVIRRFIEEESKRNPGIGEWGEPPYRLIKAVVEFIDEFYEDQAEGDCVDCEVCD